MSNFGMADVSVDPGTGSAVVKSYNAYLSGGWNNPITDVLFQIEFSCASYHYRSNA